MDKRLYDFENNRFSALNNEKFKIIFTVEEMEKRNIFKKFNSILFHC